jgi:uncharacterized membrane protein
MVLRSIIFRTGSLPSGRVEAFSDGVLTVAITLLVLEVKLPADLKSDAAMWAALREILPMFVAWVVSFAFILTFWVSHHHFFISLKHVDSGLLWLNGLFLLCISITPFPTGLVGEYPGFTVPLVLLSLAMLATSLSFALMRFYASFVARLLKDHIDPGQARTAMIQSAIAPLLYLTACGLAFVWPPGAIGIQVLVLVIFFLRPASAHAAAKPRVAPDNKA